VGGNAATNVTLVPTGGRGPLRHMGFPWLGLSGRDQRPALGRGRPVLRPDILLFVDCGLVSRQDLLTRNHFGLMSADAPLNSRSSPDQRWLTSPILRLRSPFRRAVESILPRRCVGPYDRAAGAYLSSSGPGFRRGLRRCGDAKRAMGYIWRCT
jgi:hypothetical protein